ncbi:MAG: hypothetical protein NTY33_02620 [Candidatus Moranbacteria bacterium]|nr:hypothetical protein [Candidatus Moranbacteria bacterium]
MAELAIVVMLIGVMLQAWIYDTAQTKVMEENNKLLREVLEKHGVFITDADLKEK